MQNNSYSLDVFHLTLELFLLFSIFRDVGREFVRFPYYSLVFVYMYMLR